MRPVRLAIWLAGLVLSLAAAWAIWRYAAIPDADMRFLWALAPPTVWALVPIAFWRFFGKADRPADRQSLRAQRRAVLTLLADRGFKGRRARYSVPFYLVIGAPGVGKSSLLERSGLSLTMPVTIGNATWWVGREAVFVEAGFGLPDQSLHEVGEVIAAIRPLQPVNGAILVFSPADLTLADQTELRELAQSAAQGLREIEDATGQSAPVYLALSKIDMLPGFTEFFDRQEQQERGQPWGFSVPLDASTAQDSAEVEKAVGDGFDALLEAIRMRLVEWLSREADPVRCARINGFGLQVAGLRQTMKPMLAALSPDDGTVWRSAMLRGVYLTSARQEALTIDGLLPELSRRFAMPRIGTLPPDLGLDDEDHGYFIDGVFRKAIFPEAGLVGRDKRRYAYVGNWAVVAVVIAACAAAGWLVFRTFDAEIRWAARAAEITDGIRPVASPTTLDALPTILAAIRRLDAFGDSLTEAGTDRAEVLRLSARKPLRVSIDEALRNLRENALAPSLAAMLQNQLVDLDATPETLRGLIALADAGDPADDEAIRAWLEDGAGTLPEADRGLFVEESAALFSGDARPVVDPAYVDAARRIIAYKESLS